ncbi:MAG: metallophosphoesterase [Armatimonadota bacterium]
MDYRDLALLPLIALGSWSAAYEPYNIEIKEYEFKFKNLPQKFHNCKILHMSDIHIRKFGLLEKRLINLISKKEVDYCFITGDISKTTKSACVFHKLCDSIKCSYPIYCTLGNSEHKANVDSKKIADMLSNEKISFLINEKTELFKEQDKIIVVGVDDAYSRHDDIEKGFSSVDPNDFIIYLTHCPSTAPEAIKKGANLILSGHTHGGQVRFPIIGLIWSHMRKYKYLNDGIYDTKYLRKKLKDNQISDSILYVNRGIGTSRLHIRFLCKPEIAYITLKKA